MLNQKNGYLAAILTEDSQKKLASLAVHPEIYAHHITIAFKPTEEIWKKYEDMIGQELEVEIIGIAEDENCQAALVFGCPSENENPHITISCQPGIKPVYSNDLLNKVAVEPHEMTLRVKIEFIPF